MFGTHGVLLAIIDFKTHASIALLCRYLYGSKNASVFDDETEDFPYTDIWSYGAAHHPFIISIGGPE